jgi:hypothetical protein
VHSTTPTRRRADELRICRAASVALRNSPETFPLKIPFPISSSPLKTALHRSTGRVNNDYIARANALEDNVPIYHTINGKRVAFKNINTKVASGVRQTLRVDFQGDKFTVSFDGKKVIEANDESFKDAGKVGV